MIYLLHYFVLERGGSPYIIVHVQSLICFCLFVGHKNLVKKVEETDKALNCYKLLRM